MKQLTILISFLDIIKSLNSETVKPMVVIREHFLGYIFLDETTEEFITETFIEKLEQIYYKLKICGQRYDNGTNIKEKEKRVQNKIL